MYLWKVSFICIAQISSTVTFNWFQITMLLCLPISTSSSNKMFGPHQRIQPRISKKKQKKQKKNKKKNITFQLFEFNRTHK